MVRKDVVRYKLSFPLIYDAQTFMVVYGADFGVVVLGEGPRCALAQNDNFGYCIWSFGNAFPKIHERTRLLVALPYDIDLHAHCFRLLFRYSEAKSAACTVLPEH